METGYSTTFSTPTTPAPVLYQYHTGTLTPSVSHLSRATTNISYLSSLLYPSSPLLFLIPPHTYFFFFIKNLNFEYIMIFVNHSS